MLGLTHPERIKPRHNNVLLIKLAPDKLPSGLYAPSNVEEPWPVCRVLACGPTVKDDLKVGMLVGIGELHYRAGAFTSNKGVYVICDDEGCGVVVDDAMGEDVVAEPRPTSILKLVK